MDVNMPIVRNGEFCCSQPITDNHQHSTGCASSETLTTGAAQTCPCNLYLFMQLEGELPQVGTH